MPKAKPSKLTGLRLELQDKERDDISLFVNSQVAKNVTASIGNITKPFFGSGDSGLIFTFITSYVLDELVLPDDTIVDMAIDSETGEFIFKKWWTSLTSIVPTLYNLPEGTPIPSAEMAWSSLTDEQKKQAKPILTSISYALKVTKYTTGSYLGAKVGADLMKGVGAIIPF
jgi:hypothetical protein